MRTFIAIEFSSAVRHQLQARCDRIQQQLHARHTPSVLRWTAVDNLHLTLRFLGETTAEQVQRVGRELGAALRDHGPFPLTIGGIGAFPSLDQPRIVWLGIDGDLTQLGALQFAVEQTVQTAGFAAEKRPFAAHLTLARAKRNATRAELLRLGLQLQAEDVATPIALQVNEIVHMRSDLKPGGPVYSPLMRFRLTKP